MSKTIELTEAQYAKLQSAARAKGLSSQDLLAQLIASLEERDSESAYYDTDDWFRHLGVSEDVIERVNREVREEAETDADRATPCPSSAPSPAPPPTPETPSAP